MPPATQFIWGCATSGICSMEHFCKNKTINTKLNELRRQGWEVIKTRKNHVKVTTPEGVRIMVSGSPSDFRAERKVLGDFERGGPPNTRR